MVKINKLNTVRHLDEEGGENTLLRRKLNQNLRIKSGVDKLIEIELREKFLKKII